MGIIANYSNGVHAHGSFLSLCEKKRPGYEANYTLLTRHLIVCLGGNYVSAWP